MSKERNLLKWTRSVAAATVLSTAVSACHDSSASQPISPQKTSYSTLEKLPIPVGFDIVIRPGSNPKLKGTPWPTATPLPTPEVVSTLTPIPSSTPETPFTPTPIPTTVWQEATKIPAEATRPVVAVRPQVSIATNLVELCGRVNDTQTMKRLYKMGIMCMRIAANAAKVTSDGKLASLSLRKLLKTGRKLGIEMDVNFSTPELPPFDTKGVDGPKTYAELQQHIPEITKAMTRRLSAITKLILPNREQQEQTGTKIELTNEINSNHYSTYGNDRYKAGALFIKIALDILKKIDPKHKITPVIGALDQPQNNNPYIINTSQYREWNQAIIEEIGNIQGMDEAFHEYPSENPNEDYPDVPFEVALGEAEMYGVTPEITELGYNADNPTSGQRLMHAIQFLQTHVKSKIEVYLHEFGQHKEHHGTPYRILPHSVLDNSVKNILKTMNHAIKILHPK